MSCFIAIINKKYIYTMYIYSKSAKIAFFELYPMGILWECYGYPMARSGDWQVIGGQLAGDWDVIGM